MCLKIRVWKCIIVDVDCVEWGFGLEGGLEECDRIDVGVSDIVISLLIKLFI